MGFHRVGLVIALATALLAAPARAQWREWDWDFDEDKKPWKEIEAKIPAYPRPENLVPFDGGAASPHRYFIDAASLSIGEDEVVRYTLVVRTAGGATNVSFEGIRCEERQQKYYATGRPDGNWMRARNPQWRPIDPAREVNRHHNALYQDYFCAGERRRSTVRNVKEALDRLRRGPPAIPGGGRLEQDQVVPVDELGLVHVAEFGLDVAGGGAQDAARVGRAVVDEAARDLAP